MFPCSITKTKAVGSNFEYLSKLQRYEFVYAQVEHGQTHTDTSKIFVYPKGRFLLCLIQSLSSITSLLQKGSPLSITMQSQLNSLSSDTGHLFLDLFSFMLRNLASYFSRDILKILFYGIDYCLSSPKIWNMFMGKMC